MFLPLAWLQSTASAITQHRIADIFKPLATPADSVFRLSLLVLGISTGIFLVVATIIAIAIIRFRSRDEADKQEPPQIYGSNQIEVAWTVIPILIVFVLIGVTARVVAGVEDAKLPKSAIKTTVIGHQWWWEFHYPELGIVTANELHVPLANGNARPTYLRLESMDVIHSFWIPQLAGKTDVIPNRVNEMWIDPRETGTFLGNCAEYCGTQHANMLIRVVVHPPAEFDQWVAAQQKPADNNPTEPNALQAKSEFESLSCVSCHNINGTASKGKFGPDLTHLMSRQTIGAGVLENTPKNLRSWIDDPQEAKPGCLMPSMKLTDKELDQVVAYLETLK